MSTGGEVGTKHRVTSHSAPPRDCTPQDCAPERCAQHICPVHTQHGLVGKMAERRPGAVGSGDFCVWVTVGVVPRDFYFQLTHTVRAASTGEKRELGRRAGGFETCPAP